MDNISREAAIEAIKAERVSGETETESDDAYNLGIAHAIAALSALPAVEGWLPIVSAPKDGTTFLAWCKHGQYVVSWDDDLWTVDDNKSDYIPLRGEWPTHWQPLPAPPEIE